MDEWKCCLREKAIDFQFFTFSVHLRGCLLLEHRKIVPGGNIEAYLP